jgi:hypothetical protein
MGAPLLSLTVPVIEPLVLCPSPVVTANNTSARAGINRLERNLVIISTSLLCVWKVLLLIAALAQPMARATSAGQSRQSNETESSPRGDDPPVLFS